ncbi:hypothetical protein CWD92_30660 [Burkholderia thailandensis]|nr:hypothetical protein CWD92_30660 [Burkholderia thailandensis]
MTRLTDRHKTIRYFKRVLVSSDTWGRSNLGYEYWYKVGQLLRRAAQMQTEIVTLARELEQCRARLAKA